MESGAPKTQIKNIVVLEFLVIISFALRFLFSTAEIRHPDACTYLSISKSILNWKLSTDFLGGGEIILPPLYPLITSAFYLVFRNLELSALIVSLFSGALLIIPVYILTRLIYGERSVWISSAFILFSPVLIYWSAIMYTEALFILLFISSISIGLYAIENGNAIWFFVAGITIGLTYLTRIPGIIVLGVLCGWIIICSITGKFQASKGIKFMAILFSGFIIITGPYLLHMHSVLDEWTLTASYGSVSEVVIDEGADTVQGWESHSIIQAEKSIYSQLSSKITTNLRHYLYSLFDMLTVSFLFVVIGLMKAEKGTRLIKNFKPLYLFSFILFYFLLLLILPLSPLKDERMRYLSPILPLFLILAAGGITHINIRVGKWGRMRPLKKLFMTAMIIIALFSFIPQYQMVSGAIYKFWEEKMPMDIRKETGLWMKNNLPHPIRAMSRKPFIAYYADAIYFQTPPTYEDVIRMAKDNKIDYIIIDKIVEYSLRPKLRFLFNPALAPKDLKLIGGYTHPTTGEILTGVYRIER